MKANEMEQRLYQIASLQQGYFTARQAKEIGYADSRFPYHVRKGRWIREGRGIYKLANYPTGDRPDLVYWSRRRGEESIPKTLPAPPVNWRTSFSQMAIDCGLNPDFDAAFSTLERYWQELQHEHV